MGNAAEDHEMTDTFEHLRRRRDLLHQRYAAKVRRQATRGVTAVASSPVLVALGKTLQEFNEDVKREKQRMKDEAQQAGLPILWRHRWTLECRIEQSREEFRKTDAALRRAVQELDAKISRLQARETG